MYVSDKRHPVFKPGTYQTHTFICEHCHYYHRPYTILNIDKPKCFNCGKYPFKEKS